MIVTAARLRPLNITLYPRYLPFKVPLPCTGNQNVNVKKRNPQKPHRSVCTPCPVYCRPPSAARAQLQLGTGHYYAGEADKHYTRTLQTTPLRRLLEEKKPEAGRDDLIRITIGGAGLSIKPELPSARSPALSPPPLST